MQMLSAVVGGFITFALILGPVRPGSAQDKEFEKTFSIARGLSIEIKGVYGDIEAEATSGDRVRVRAIKRGRDNKIEEVEIGVVEHDGGITICAQYPRKNRRGLIDCVPGPWRDLDIDSFNIKVEFEIEVPSGVHLIARTINGDIEVDLDDSNVLAFTMNGSIEIETEGYAEAKTVNGNIEASLGRTDWDGKVEFHSVNGSVTVELPADADTRVRANTFNGRVSSDFPINIRRGRFVGGRASGTLGRGNRSIELKTINGRIHLRKND